MALCVVCALLICSVIVALFASAFFAAGLALLIASLFVAAMLAFIAALVLFLREVHLATSNLRIGHRHDQQLRGDIFHKDFQAMPYWWEAYRPVTGDLVDVPRATRVAIVGGGYAGLSCAIELADAGFEAACWRQPSSAPAPAREAAAVSAAASTSARVLLAK